MSENIRIEITYHEDVEDDEDPEFLFHFRDIQLLMDIDSEDLHGRTIESIETTSNGVINLRLKELL